MYRRQAVARYLRLARGRRHISIRLQSTVTQSKIPPFPVAARPNDDIDISPYFDHPRQYLPTITRPLAQSSNVGLFGQPELSSPQNFFQLAVRTVNRAQILVDRIVNARGSYSEMTKVVKNLDRLSDMLCGVIDSAELIRHAHPHPDWVEAANQVYEQLCSYMNVLNTNVELYEILRDVFADKSISTTFTYEQRQTALIFLRDFEKSGIHLSPDKRTKFVSLSDEIISLGREFQRPGPSPASPVQVKRSDLEGLPDSILRKFSRPVGFNRKLRIVPGSWEASVIMKYSPVEALRRSLFVGEMHPRPQKIEALEKLLAARDQLAKLVGKETYAEWTLEDKMAGNPENVRHFLSALADHHRPLALSELTILGKSKQEHLSLKSPPSISAWDRDFYTTLVESQQSYTHSSESLDTGENLVLFSAGTVFQGLTRLFSRIYGLRLVPRDVTQGEVWHPDVKRLDVVDETEGTIGVLYVDLWARRGKAPGAAHYTVKCSRRIDDDDEASDFTSEASKSIRDGGHAMIMSEAGATFPGKEGIYKLPVAALVCDFISPAGSKVPSALTWPEVSTLFHEMGHALHSMIGRTDYQNVSGTRCSTDFVELPSILMEHFLASPSVFSLFPTHHLSIKHSDLLQHIHQLNPFPSLDTHSQILMATLDQTYHSTLPSMQSFSSTRELHRLQDSLGVIPSVPETAWQTQFHHLYGYGATYYTYLFDRAIAGKVWRNMFEKDPLDSRMGERYKNEVLKFGGGKDPWKILATLLNMPEIEGGDHKAMELVGHWGVQV